MMISEKEAKTLAEVYVVAKQIVFIAGIVVLVAVVLGLFRAAYVAGQHNAAPVAPVVPAPAAAPGEEPATPRPVHRRRVAPPPVTDETGQSEAEPETKPDGWPVGDVPAEHVTGTPATPPPMASPVIVLPPPVVADPVPDFSVIAKPKRHRWPRRLVGAIGRGLGKVIGVR
jgi:hypothetical protein